MPHEECGMERRMWGRRKARRPAFCLLLAAPCFARELTRARQRHGASVGRPSGRDPCPAARGRGQAVRRRPHADHQVREQVVHTPGLRAGWCRTPIHARSP